MNDKLWIANTNITSGIYPIVNAYREEPMSKDDSGWRLISAGDTEKFLAQVKNTATLTLEEVLALEPAFDKVKDLPAGTELSVVYGETETTFLDYETQELVA